MENNIYVRYFIKKRESTYEKKQITKECLFDSFDFLDSYANKTASKYSTISK